MKLVKVKVLFFAKAREIVGKSFDYIDLNSCCNYQQLLDKIVSKYCLNEIKQQIILSVNEKFWQPNETDTITLKPDDEIAVIPPLSGG